MVGSRKKDTVLRASNNLTETMHLCVSGLSTGCRSHVARLSPNSDASLEFSERGKL